MLSSCFSIPGKKQRSLQCIKTFTYKKQEAVGPESLGGIIITNDNELRKLLLNKPPHYIFHFSGGIYDIDSIYFPPPYVDIYDVKDTSIFFVQNVFGLRQISTKTLDSLINQTEKNIHIEIQDTITDKKWVLVKCSN